MCIDHKIKYTRFIHIDNSVYIHVNIHVHNIMYLTYTYTYIYYFVNLETKINAVSKIVLYISCHRVLFSFHFVTLIYFPSIGL